MTEDVIHYRSERLANRLAGFLAKGAVSAKFAVGYLFFEGLLPLRAELEKLPEAYLLIGNVESRLTNEQIHEEVMTRPRGGEGWVRDQEDVASTLRTAHDRCSVETALNVRRTIDGLKRTPEMQDLLLILANRIAEGSLKVRVYRHGRIHTKLALVEYPAGSKHGNGIAIVGASNLTLGGAPHPTELNVVVREAAAIAELQSWYDDLWSRSQDFQRELFEELGCCWAFKENAGKPGKGQG